MEVVVLFNGLGNQMSQYAFYLAKCEAGQSCMLIVDKSISEQHNGFELNRIFNIHYKESIAPRILKIIYYKNLFGTRLGRMLGKFGVRVINEPQNYDYDLSILNVGPSTINFYRGGWHCEKYFIKYRNLVKRVFQFNLSLLNEQTRAFSSQILSIPISVSIHVRRGDYLSKPWGIYDFSGVATESYYNDALAYLKNKLGSEINCYVFSDDITWCKSFFGENGFIYVDCNHGLDSWQDMYLISLCTWHINANSTFSWWGAWLSEHPENTIVPKSFLRNINTPDIYPDSWAKL